MNTTLHSPDEGALNIWVICFNPKDYPGLFAVRRWVTLPGRGEPIVTPGVQTAPSLAAARQLLPPGLVCLNRDPGDDPVIVETWL